MCINLHTCEPIIKQNVSIFVRMQNVQSSGPEEQDWKPLHYKIPPHIEKR